MRSESEIRNYLKKYTKDINYIDKLINKLKDNNYINEELYLKSYLHDKINLSMDGPLKIKKDLENMSFNLNDIEDKLQIYTKDIINEKIERYINKQ